MLNQLSLRPRKPFCQCLHIWFLLKAGGDVPAHLLVQDQTGVEGRLLAGGSVQLPGSGYLGLVVHRFVWGRTTWLDV